MLPTKAALPYLKNICPLQSMALKPGTLDTCDYTSNTFLNAVSQDYAIDITNPNIAVILKYLGSMEKLMKHTSSIHLSC